MVVVFILIIAAVCTGLNLMCVLIGAKIGQKVVKGEPIELPQMNPIEAIRENKQKNEQRRAEERERRREDILLHNIDIYDGTSNGQREVPKR